MSVLFIIFEEILLGKNFWVKICVVNEYFFYCSFLCLLVVK